MNVETEITPPDTDEDGDGDDRSTRILDAHDEITARGRSLLKWVHP